MHMTVLRDEQRRYYDAIVAPVRYIFSRSIIACSAGVFFGSANVLLAKGHVETRKEGRKWGESKGAGKGTGREKRKHLPENTVKIRNTP